MIQPLAIHLSGNDISAIASAIMKWPWYTELPQHVDIDDRERKATAAWREQVLRAKSLGHANWDQTARSNEMTMVTVVRSRYHEVVLATAREWMPSVTSMLGLLADVPFALAAFHTFWPVEWKTLGVHPPGFGDEHGQLGWGCAFRGTGHDRLVSRRWLDFGPWKVWRAPGDLSLVQFHDLAASAEEALRQATPGHRRMGISETGGFLQSTDWGARLEGIYTAEERSMEIIIAGREVSQEEMLEACFVRRARRADPDKPIERVAYVFLETAAARAHLHELWLRELECWTIEDGDKRRLDLDYQPVPSPPEWVASLPGS